MDGTVVRAFASLQSSVGLILAQCHMWAKFVVGFCLAPMVFSRFSGFLPPQKPTSLNSNSIRIEDPHETS